MPPVVTRHSAPYPGRLATLLVLVLALLCAAPRTMANPIEDAQVLLNVTFNAASQQLTLACYLKPAKACYNSVISLYKTTLAIPSKAPSTLTLMERSQLTETGTTHFSGRKSSIEVSDFDPSEVWCFNKLTFDASETDSGDYSCGATYVFRNQKYTVQQSEVTAVRTVSTPVVKMLNIQQTYVLNENETSKEIECQVKTSNTEKVQVQFMLGDTDMTSSFPQVDSSQEDNGGINNPIPSLITYTRLYRGTIDVSQELRDKRLKCSATLQLDAPTANSLQVLVGSNKASEVT